MSTVEDFKNAPVGATATHAYDGRAMKMGDVERRWIVPIGRHMDDEEMAGLGYTLEPSAPESAREALDLTWDLAHEVKPGQVIPWGTRLLKFDGSEVWAYTAQRDFKIMSKFVPKIRTLERLPGTVPYWIDAPAVLARHDEWDRDKLDVFTPAREGDGRWTRAGISWGYHWSELRDVTPLYPLAEGTMDGTTAPEGYTPANSMGFKNEETK